MKVSLEWTTTLSGAVQGVRSASTRKVPQAIPVFSGAVEPLKSSNLMSSKGSWGISEIVIVSRPVCGSASISPGSLVTTPDCGSLTLM